MGLDSVELLMKVEKAFSINISDQEAELITTVSDFHWIVWLHLENKPSGRDEAISREEMVSKINHIIADFIGLELEEVTPEKSLTNDLGID